MYKWIKARGRRWVYAIPTRGGLWYHSARALIIQCEDGFYWKIYGEDLYGVRPSKRRAMWEIRGILRGL
jgi:hypothetical protein